MELRKVFDLIPDRFDKYRPRYSKECFDYIIDYTGLKKNNDILEIGPGTGQATEYLLDYGMKYLGIELGTNLYNYMITKYKDKDNFSLLNDDFITYDFDKKFDMIISAATIQWIPEDIAYSKSYKLLNDNGYLVMIMTKSDYKSKNELIYQKIQEVYKKYFHPEVLYSQKFNYLNGINYGFTYCDYKEFTYEKELNAEEFVGVCGTHCDHINLKDPDKTNFFNGIYEIINNNDNKVIMTETIKIFILKK